MNFKNAPSLANIDSSDRQDTEFMEIHGPGKPAMAMTEPGGRTGSMGSLAGGPGREAERHAR